MVATSSRCPNCGAGRQRSPSGEAISCDYCGTLFQATISSTGATFSKLLASSDRTGAERALIRLKEELAEIEKRLRLSCASRPTPPSPPRKQNAFSTISSYLDGRAATDRAMHEMDKLRYEASLRNYGEALKNWETAQSRRENWERKRGDLTKEIVALQQILKYADSEND